MSSIGKASGKERTARNMAGTARKDGKRLLKVDFHSHTLHYADPDIDYSWKELIDEHSRQGFDALAITNHHTITYSKEMADYAKRKGILLISSTEAMIEEKDVLIININKGEKIPKTFDDLKRLDRNNRLIIAPHPYFVFHSLGRKLSENISLFDGIEYSHFYTPLMNLNRKTERMAKKYSLPLIGTSDAHNIFQIGHTYTLVQSKNDADSIIKAVKEGRCRLHTEPLSISMFLKIVSKIIFQKRHKNKSKT